MSGWITGGLVVGGLISAGGSIYGQSQSNAAANAASNKGFRRALALEPNTFSSGLEALIGQAQYGTGAAPEDLEVDLIGRQIEQNGIPQNARDFRTSWNQLQSLANQGISSGRAFDIAWLGLQGLLNTRGYGTLSWENGRPVLRSNDPGIRSIVDAARRDSGGILADRLTGERNLARLAADFPTATGEEIDALTKTLRASQLREIATERDKRGAEILQQANTRGYNPAGVIGELERNAADASFDTEFTAADRALQILTGRQAAATGSISGINAALSPARFLALLNGDQQAAAQSQTAATVGQLAAAQTAAGANAGSGTAQAASTIGDIGTLLALLSGSGRTGTNASLRGPAAGNGDRISSGGIDLTDLFLKS